jgi:hypothetical protein
MKHFRILACILGLPVFLFAADGEGVRQARDVIYDVKNKDKGTIGDRDGLIGEFEVKKYAVQANLSQGDAKLASAFTIVFSPDDDPSHGVLYANRDSQTVNTLTGLIDGALADNRKVYLNYKLDALGVDIKPDPMLKRRD